MTNIEELERLLEALRSEFDTGLRTIGGSAIAGRHANAVTIETWGSEPIMALRNPNGPAAATAIEGLLSHIRELREARTWQPIETAPEGVQLLGYTPGCGYEVIRKHSDGNVYAGAFDAKWVKFWQHLPEPPSILSDKGEGDG
jgi:hypothetical protein